MRQEDDVLDTWFSSALWPFSTLGWPDKTKTLAAYYPTSTLSTDRSIIYFWVARMVMMGLKFMNDVPFRDVYIHGTILDEQGRKMSKSSGNGIDPIDIINQYGADAMRFSLVVLSTEGQDLKLSISKFEMGRNFCNKLWNATRFVMMNLGPDQGKSRPNEKDFSLADKWILSSMQKTINYVIEELENFRFSNAAQELYRFTWNDFCDWYLEAAKLHLTDKADPTSSSATKYTLKHVLSQTLKLLHPFLPFITEEIWSHLHESGKPIIISEYPKKAASPFDADATSFEWYVKEAVEAIRNIRGESNVPPAKRISNTLASVSNLDQIPAITASYIEHLARVTKHTYFADGAEPKETEKAATSVTIHQKIYVPMAGLIDIEAETARLTKEISRVENDITSVERKLSNESFVKNAPSDIVDKEKQRLTGNREKLATLKEALQKVKAL